VVVAAGGCGVAVVVVVGVGSRGPGGFGASAQPLNASMHPNQTHTPIHYHLLHLI